MRKSIVFSAFIIAFSAFVLTGCDDSEYVYSNQLNKERQIIADYIKREGINILKERPANGEWGEKDYIEVDGYDYLYFHLINPGDVTQDTVQAGDMVALRYKCYTLDEYADTIDNRWSTTSAAYPIEFRYGSADATIATAWNVAVGEMYFTDAECRIICPSKLDIARDEDQDNRQDVIPYGYDIKIKIRKW